MLPGDVWGVWPLVGRERELQRVIAAMAEPGSRGFLFAGEAGVGKSRLSRECLHVASERGLTTRSLIATRSAATIPFGALATLLPARAQHPSSRAGLLRAAQAAVEGLAGNGRLVLTVDDANLLDPLSAVLLHQLAESHRVFLVVTVRTGDPVPDAVTGLWKDGLLHRVDLGPLSQAECDRLVEEVLGGPVDGATRWDLWVGCRGNVLVLRELMLGALTAGFLVRPLAATPRLVDLVAARLSELAEPELEALELVALAEPVDVGLLGGLAELTTVLALEQRGLISVDSDDEAKS